MKGLKWGLLIALVAAAVVVFSAKFFRKDHTFYYYPEWNAYYDVRNKSYIYSVDGGKSWNTITNSSNTVTNTLGEKIVLHGTTPKIWMENEQHRKQYGGAQNDLVGNFLKTGEDKRKIEKKNTDKDSIDYTLSNRDSLVSDSVQEVENWVKETAVDKKAVKQYEGKNPAPDSAVENIVVPETEDSTEEQADD